MDILSYFKSFTISVQISITHYKKNRYVRMLESITQVLVNLTVRLTNTSSNIGSSIDC